MVQFDVPTEVTSSHHKHSVKANAKGDGRCTTVGNVQGTHNGYVKKMDAR